jgi:periplasmic protein TonB
MTIAFADTVDRQENKDFTRWGASLLLVLAFHVAVAWLLLPREAAVEPNKPPPPAALLDLPPLPPAGAGGKPGSPPPPKPAVQPLAPPKSAVTQPVPPKPPVQQAKPPVPPPTSPIPKIAVPLPIAPKALLPKPQPPKPQPPKTAAAPTPTPSGYASPVLLDPIRTWQLGVIERLQQSQYWPPDIRRGQFVSAVDLHFVIDRQGKILSCSIAISSGIPSVDAAALETARRAQRLPPLPASIPGATFAFTMTFRFL